MCKIKYFRFFEKSVHILIWESVGFLLSFFKIIIKSMNFNKNNKNLTSEIKEVFKKSKLNVITNENDFLVKNLKKAGK